MEITKSQLHGATHIDANHLFDHWPNGIDTFNDIHIVVLTFKGDSIKSLFPMNLGIISAKNGWILFRPKTIENHMLIETFPDIEKLFDSKTIKLLIEQVNDKNLIHNLTLHVAPPVHNELANQWMAFIHSTSQEFPNAFYV